MPDNTHSTIKEESINISEKPENFGTPAHPKPKFLSKNSAMFFLGFVITSIILSFIFGGIFLAGN